MTTSRDILQNRLWLTIKSIGHGEELVKLSFGQSHRRPGRRFFHHTRTVRNHVNATTGAFDGPPNANSSYIEEFFSRDPVSKSVPRCRDGGLTPSIRHGRDKLIQSDGEVKPGERYLEGIASDAQHAPKAARTYWRRVEGQQKCRKSRQIRRFRYQRHNFPEHTGDWQPTLRLLERAMPDPSTTNFAKRMTTITSQEGAAFVFKGNAGSSVLDIMDRSGAHVQIVPDGIDEGGGFTQLALWGNPEQKSKAMSLLPDYVRYLSSNNSTEGHEPQKTLEALNVTSGSENTNTANPTTIGSRIHQESNETSDPQRDKLTGDTASRPKLSTFSFRAVWSKPHLPETSELDVMPVDLPGTSLKLTRKIQALISKRPPLKQRQSQPAQSATGSASSPDVIAIELENILLSQSNLAMLAPKSLDVALAYLLRHRKHPSVFKIFDFLRQHGYQLTSSNYVSLCAVAAGDGHVRNFHMVVESMLKQRVVPTPEIWVQFLQLVVQHSSPSVVQTLRSHMKRTGLLCNRAIAIDVLELTTSMDLESHLRQPDTNLTTFIKWRDNLAKEFDVGNIWFTRATLNRMVHYFLKSYSTPDLAFQAIDEARSRNVHPTASVLNGFLAHAKHHGSVSLMIQYLRVFALAPIGTYSYGDGTVRIGPRRGLKMPLFLDSVSFNIMFRTAWTSKHWNCLRVLWVFACTSGNLNKLMLEDIRRSLLRNWQSEPSRKPSIHTRSQLETPNVRTAEAWRNWIGNFVLGGTDASERGNTALNSPSAVPSFLPPSKLKDDLVKDATTPVNVSSEIPKSRIQKLESLLQDDLSKLQNLRPSRTLIELLEEAYELDKKWRVQHSDEWHALHDDLNPGGRAADLFSRMMEAGIKIPVQLGDGTKFWSFASSLVDTRLLPEKERSQLK